WVGGERPVVLLGLGLKRAFLSADRLVWRLPAEPVEPTPADPPAPFERAVHTAEGDLYWVAEPAILLRDVAPPSILDLARGLAPAAPPDVPTPSVPPIIAPPEPVAAPADTRAAEVPPAAGARPTARRALVAEDSITARIFLWRMLEQYGFEVHTVASVAELETALTRGPWSLICVDVDLPDGHAARHLGVLAETFSDRLVALTRDAEDETAAAAAGARRLLPEP